MPEIVFPPLQAKPVRKSTVRSCAGHRAWVRRHACSVRGCRLTPIESAHVRTGTDGATGMKPSDQWVISLCANHHREQHQIGEIAFEQRYSLDLVTLAQEFARRSPYRGKFQV
jgi:Putative HNHc nuclease